MPRKLHSTIAALCGVTLVVGCAQTSPTAEFTGPWAEESNHAYATTGSDYVRAILEDEVITDQEYAETVARYRECMTAAGITINSYVTGGGGSYSFPPEMGSDVANRTSEECSDTAGEKWVSSYSFVQRNPEHVDELTILIQCFVDAGIVEPGYTKENYQHDSMEGPFFPLKDPEHDKPLHDECNADPLGLMP